MTHPVERDTRDTRDERRAAPQSARDPLGATADALAFGGFQLGGLSLALPMAALREVVPCSDLQPLACPAACVIGGITLRGVLVPVVDLRLALGRPAAAPGAGSCVIVMVEGGCILGLLADGVSGVFSAAAGSVSRMQPHPQAAAGDATAAILAGTVQTAAAGEGPPAMLLSPAALARLPQVPLVIDPEPQRQHSRAAGSTPSAPVTAATTPAATTPAASAASAARPVMLARCGAVLLAIDAMGVHTTLAHPQVRPSPLAMGHCRGVIEHGGAVPLVDLLALCGLGRTDLSGEFQAFLVRAGDGLVGFAVDAVIDVVRVADAAVVPVPRFALAHPALFAGALPMAALAPEVAARAGTPAQQFLVLDAVALKAHADVAGLGATGRPLGDAARAAAQDTGAGARGRPLRNLVTYSLAGETATPIEQVSEILPYVAGTSAFGACGAGGALQGMVMNRGRSIPLLCLSRLQGLPPPRHGADASVLVVASAGEHLGFIVPQLRSIEPGEWPLVGRADGQAGAAAAGGPLDTRGLARLGSGADQRLLPVLDLLALARRLQSPAEALTA